MAIWWLQTKQMTTAEHNSRWSRTFIQLPNNTTKLTPDKGNAAVTLHQLSAFILQNSSFFLHFTL